jgi:septum formation protein
MRRIILASTSPYRRELLSRLGLPFEAAAPSAEEHTREGETPAAMAARLALAKAQSISASDALVIGSDQVPSLQGRVLRKPGTHEAALRQLEACQGRTVTFFTAAVVLDTATDRWQEHVDRTDVVFAQLTPEALERYLRIEQPYDCAGSFKAEGLGVALFERIDSHDPTALIGLPLIFVAAALKAAGADPLDAVPASFRAP